MLNAPVDDAPWRSRWWKTSTPAVRTTSSGRVSPPLRSTSECLPGGREPRNGVVPRVRAPSTTSHPGGVVSMTSAGRGRRPEKPDDAAGLLADARHQLPRDDRHDGGDARHDQKGGGPSSGASDAGDDGRAETGARREPACGGPGSPAGRAFGRLGGRRSLRDRRNLRGLRNLRLRRKRVERIGNAAGRRGSGTGSVGAGGSAGVFSGMRADSLTLTSSPPRSPPCPCARPW